MRFKTTQIKPGMQRANSYLCAHFTGAVVVSRTASIYKFNTLVVASETTYARVSVYVYHFTNLILAAGIFAAWEIHYILQHPFAFR